MSQGFVVDPWRPQYALTNGAAKLSIAFFLVELTPELDFERVVLHILAGLAASWTVVFVVTSLFQCIPPSDAWKDGRQGNCLDHVALRIAQRTMSVFVDLMLLASSAKLMWPAPILSCSRVAYFSSIGAGTLFAIPQNRLSRIRIWLTFEQRMRVRAVLDSDV